MYVVKLLQAENGEKCPIAPVAPVMGKTVEYSYSMNDIKNAMLKVHRWIISEFKDIHHVQKVAELLSI